MQSLPLSLLLAVGLITGCDGDTTTDDTGTPQDTDTGTTQDTDTADTAHTGDTQDTDTGDTQPVGEKLTGTLVSLGDGPTADLTVSLSALLPGEEMFTLGDTLAVTTSAKDGSWSLPLDDPPAEALFEADPENMPGTMVWLGAPIAFEDVDENGKLASGEPLLGMNMAWLLGFVTGTIPDGWTEGWALVDTSTMDQEGGPDFLPVDPLEITLRGQIVSDLTLGGTWTPTEPAAVPQTLGFVMVPLDGTMSPDLAVVIADLNPLVTPWSVELSGPPEALYTLSDSEDDGFDMVGAYGVASTYRDTDKSGDFDAGADAITGTSMCAPSGEPVLTLWLEPPVDISGLMMLEMLGYRAGWTPLRWADDREGPPAVLDEADRQSLSIDEGCTIGG